jgi:ring-1,2-phenylacetyl-CoA epoxidase subunit PaaD
MDPEIPVLSIVDLGIITDVTVTGESVTVKITPTFVGCPALDAIRNEIAIVLESEGVAAYEIEVTLEDGWTSDRISEKGRKALKKFGLAPPPLACHLVEDLTILERAQCPRCNSTNTDMRSLFGATLCRSTHYCNDCREAFEQFKPL